MKIKTVSIIVMIILLLGCSDKDNPVEAPSPPDYPNQIIEGINDFGWDFFNALETEQDTSNIVTSPSALYHNLSATYIACKYGTKDEMELVLGVQNMPDSQFLESIKSVFDSLLTETQNCSFSQKFAVFDYMSCDYSEEHENQLKQYFYHEYYEMENYHDSIVLDSMEIWYEGAINSDFLFPDSLVLVDKGMLDINLSYFVSQWDNSFNLSQNTIEDFNNPMNGIEQIEMINGSINAPYYQDSLVQVVQMPFAGGNYEIILVLPTSTTWPVQNNCLPSKEKLTHWLNNSDSVVINITMPQIYYNDHVSRVDALNTVGVNRIFSIEDSNYAPYYRGCGKAVYLGWDEFVGLKINHNGAAFVGKSKIDNNETSSIDIKFDRPYYFIIRHCDTGIIVSIGRIINPNN